MAGILFGAPGTTRTYDLRLRSPLLYPTELRGQVTAPNYTRQGLFHVAAVDSRGHDGGADKSDSANK